MNRATHLLAACALLTTATVMLAVAHAAPAPVPIQASAFHAPLFARAPLMGLARAGARLVAVGDYGIVLVSDDGITWRQAREVPTRDTLTAVWFVDAQRGFAVGHGGTVLTTADGGETWTWAHAAGADVTLLTVWFENATHGIAAGAFGRAIETRDGGRTWKALAVGEGDDRDRHLNAVFGAGNDVYIAAEAGTFFRSTDGGAHFAAVRLPYNGSMWGGLVLHDASVLVFGMRGHALRSSDHGVTWTDVPTGGGESLCGAVELADGRVALVGLSGAVALSRDGARTFTTTARADRQSYTGVAETASGSLAIVGLGGVATHAAK